MGGLTALVDGNDALLSNFSQVHDSVHWGVILLSENRFSLSELTSISLGGFLNAGNHGHIGLTASQYGNNLYSDRSMAVHYARSLSKSIKISGKLGWEQLQLESYGMAQSLIFSLGLSGQISKSLGFGLLISNPERQSFHATTKLISSIAFGLRYKVANQVTCYAEVAKELEHRVGFRVGLEYVLHDKLHIRTGYNTVTGGIGAGFTYLLNNLVHVDFGTQFHSILGLSPAISLKFLNSHSGD